MPEGISIPELEDTLHGILILLILALVLLPFVLAVWLWRWVTRD